jgi:short-subunit dehydrogenase
LETEEGVEERIFAVNFWGSAALTRMVLPHMLRRKSGRIAAVTSLLAKFGAPNRSAYAASKHALHGWYDSLREEILGSGVSVTLLVPGWIKTDISVRALDNNGEAHGLIDEGQRRGITPEEAARRMVRAIDAGKEEQLIGGWECLSAYGMRFFPRLTRYCLRKYGIG